MEPLLPGIQFAARNLIASLVFGLSEIARIKKRFTSPLSGVESLARLLVRRMANARTVMLRAAELAERQRQRQIQRIFWKLESSKQLLETRAIYRGLRHLPAADCRESLQWMESVGLVCRVDEDTWKIAEGARLDFDRCTVPLLEG